MQLSYTYPNALSNQTFSVQVTEPGGGVVSPFALGFSTPAQMVRDSAGNFYVPNFIASTVSRITTSGVVGIFASGFNLPDGIAIDAAGNLYVSNSGHGSGTTVSKVTPGGVVTLFAGGFNNPRGLVFDAAGNLYVASDVNQFVSNTLGFISMVTPGGVVSTFATGLNTPRGMAFDSAGILHVANDMGGTISKVTPGGVVSTFVTGLNRPIGLQFDPGGNLMVTSYGANAVLKVTPTGVISTYATGLNGPLGLVYGSDGNLYVSNANISTVSKLVLTTLGSTSASTSTFSVASADSIPPTANPTQSPAANAAGWNTTDVTIAWNWTDNAGGSGIDASQCTTSSISSGEGAAITLNATCTDLAGNTGNASYTVKVDKTPPDTAITSQIDGNSAAVSNGGATASTSMTFQFSGTDNIAVARLECSLDGAAFTTCTSPLTLTGLLPGSHTFAVSAVDTAGNVDATPASFTWIVKAPQVITLTGVPASATYGAGFTVTGTGGGSGNPVTFTSSGGCSNVAGVTMTSGTTACAVIADQAGDANYSAAPQSTQAVGAAKKAASVTPNPAGKEFGAPEPPLTGTLSGFLVGDGVTATYSRAPGETLAGNPYLISATLSPAGVLGNYTIAYNTASFTIVDTIPPVIGTVTPNPGSLWPPNHKMVNVTVVAKVRLRTPPVCTIAGATSSEPDNGQGDGDTAGDIRPFSGLGISLRARGGKGPGRIYTLTVSCTDGINASTKTTTVTVPKSQGK